jgi:phosphohistidine phosphatase
MQEFATTVASGGDAFDQLRSKFPTGALAEILLPDVPWSDLKEGSGQLTRFVTPRALEVGG